MKYRLTEDALADLDGLWFYIAEDNVDAADRVVTSILAACARLAERPRIGHSRRDITDRPVLFWNVGKYTIVYRPDEAPLRVIAVLHGARDLAPILDDRE
jgi:plasmid stabilization system protein ParE